MACLLKMATVQQILSLHADGWSQRRIARELGISRDAVSRYLQLARSDISPASAPGLDAEEPVDASRPAPAPTGSASGLPPAVAAFQSQSRSRNSANAPKKVHDVSFSQFASRLSCLLW
jgi:hypothetical protein